jgi:hypothetical protein
MSLEKILKDLFWDALVQLALKKLFQLIPWLGWGPLGILVSWVVGHFADLAFEALVQYVDHTSIAFRNAAMHRAYVTASLDLRKLAHEKGIDSEDFRLAREEHKKRLSEFVQWAA